MNEDIHYSIKVLFLCDLKKRRKRGISYAPSARYGPERGDGWGVRAHYLQLLQVSL